MIILLRIITHLVATVLMYAGMLWFMFLGDITKYKRQIKTVKFHILTIGAIVIVQLMISAWW